MKRVLLADIRIDGGTQPRAEIDQDVVREYAEAMTDGAEFPAVVVFFDGVAYWLADGFHRYHAANSLQHKHIEAKVEKGTQRDAILYSVSANAAHGLRRTNLDKRRAVGVLLADAEWCAKSDRWIAEKCGVSHPFVMGLRPQAVTVTTSAPATRTGQDGKTYPARQPPKPTAAPEPEESEDPEPEEQERKEPKQGQTHPCVGMHFARMAVMKLEEIREDDEEREQALNHVKAWIKGQQK